jgi:hypothetical protein
MEANLTSRVKTKWVFFPKSEDPPELARKVVSVFHSQLKQRLRLGLIKIILSIFSSMALFWGCSNCHLIQNNLYQNLAEAKNTQLEIHIKNGQTYSTCNFTVIKDTLLLKDNITPFNPSALKVPLNSIKSIRCCKLGEKGADYRGLIFTAVLLGILLLLPENAFNPGG